MGYGWIDLHTHTTASDGSLTPSQLVESALSIGLEAVAITDHDTADGIGEALEAGTNSGIRVVPGVEISARMKERTLHLLGYAIDPEEKIFAAGIERLKQARADRNPKIILNLQGMGISITLEQVEAKADGGLVGRPHIAETLVEAGAAASIQEAFDKYLASDAAAYEHKFRLDPASAIQLILGAGGIPVMAHPYQTERNNGELRRLVWNLRGLGLEGIEVYYSHHTPEQTAFYRELANDFDLVQTGGTDFHGKRKMEVKLGWGKGDLRVPADLLEGLDQRIARLRNMR